MQDFRQRFGIDLSEQQAAVVTHSDGPSLILAVPGGGKTTTLLCRTAYLIKELHVNPREILTLTFSRASANDMKQRYEELFASKLMATGFGEKVHFSTIHSFTYQVVMHYYQQNRCNLRLIEGSVKEQPSKSQLLRHIYHQINEEYLQEGDYEGLVNAISYIKNIMLNKEEINNYKSGIQNFHAIFGQYEAIKAEQGLIDFDDMLTHCYRIFCEEPLVLKHYQERYRYIQVDEAQDTSQLQHAIIELLVNHHKNVFYVADDDQSIYGFRGACPQYLLDMKSIYPQVKIYRMEENYRSTGHIVKVSNRFIKANTKRFEKEIFTCKEEGYPIEIRQVLTLEKQYDDIINGLAFTNDYEKHAILYRNNDSAVYMAQKLHEKGIGFYIRDFRGRFFEHWIVKDMLDMMTFAHDTTQIQLFSQFYYKLKGFYISKQMIEQAKTMGQGSCSFERLLQANDLEGYKREKLNDLKYHFQILKRKKVEEAIGYIRYNMGYEQFLEDRTDKAEGQLSNYQSLLTLLAHLGKDVVDVYELKDKLGNLEKIMNEATHNLGKKVVTLSTAHSSKGLEWDNVYLIDLLEGTFPPHIGTGLAGQLQLEEERRLFYVAMTRARQGLVLYQTKQGMPSQFLDEVQAIIGERPPLRPGTLVRHKKYGHGEVTTCTAIRIRIKFNGKSRELDYRHCMKNGLITVL